METGKSQRAMRSTLNLGMMSIPGINHRGRSSKAVRRSTPIAAGFEDCLQTFDQLLGAVEASPELWSSQQMASVKDELSRLRVWGGETGASSRSLDHALRKASKLQQQVVALLDDLRMNVQKAIEIVRGAAVLFSPSIKFSENVEYFKVLPRQGQAATPAVEDQQKQDPAILFSEVAIDMNDCMECLCAIAPAMKDPVPQDTYHRNASPNEARRDIVLVERIFPTASRILLERLGTANWKRRQYQRELRVRMNSGTSTEENIIISIAEAGGSQTQRAQAAQNSRQSYSRDVVGKDRRSDFTRVALSGAFSDTGLLSNPDTVFSDGSYFERVSISSVAESSESSKLHLRDVPNPPILLEPGKSFICHFCLHEIVVGEDISSMDDWIQHVFLDVEPYVCTADEMCTRGDKTYGQKPDWFTHELTHRLIRVLFCQSCRLEFHDKVDLGEHLRLEHGSTVNPEQLELMLPILERFTQQPLLNESCNLCGMCCMNAEMLRDHIATHLEQLALSSLDGDDFPYEGSTNSKPTTQSAEYSRTVQTAAKKEQLLMFLAEQQQNRFASTDNRGAWKNISTESDLGLLEDSEDDMPAKPIIKALESNALPSRPKRPAMKRHGETLLTNWKVENFLESNELVDPEILSTIATPTEVAQDPLALAKAAAPITRVIRTMPPPRNDGFIGRQSDLAKLYKELSVPGHTCILSGAGGMGKSATAIEYTYQFEKTYAYIFWILAETPVGCADSYSRIATTFVRDEEDIQDQERMIMLSRSFLEELDKPWLIVFDNVDELVDLDQYLPRNLLETKGSVLITTRKIDLGSLTAPSYYARIELRSLDLDESRRLLLSSRGTHFDDIKHHPEYNVAGQIATFAEQLPLALSSIKGFVEVSGCSLDDFVSLWKENQRHSITRQSPVENLLSSTDRALEIVWNIGLREVTTDARELLNILPFLDSDTIQKDILVGEHSERSLQFLHSSEVFRYKRMTAELSRRRLIAIRKRDDEEVLSIHRSLQAKILQDLEKDTSLRDKAYSQAFLLVRKRFPLPSPIQVPTLEAWPACIKYLRHVLSLRKVYTGTFITIPPSVDLARLLSDGGINLWERGMTSEGLQLLESAETILDQLDLKSSEDMLRANIHVIVALLLQDFGLSRVDESNDRIGQALQIRKDFEERTPKEKYTKNDDILLHNAWSDHGCILLQYNNFKEAEPIFHLCLERYRQWGLDESIPYEHAKYNHHMSFCKMYAKEFEESIALGERGVKFVILATGEKSSSAYKWKFDLACIILQSGDVERALVHHEEVLEARIQQHGRSNFLTLQSLYAVGAIYDYIGDIKKAESYMRDALELEASRRDTYPEAAIARTKFHLSQILSKTKQNSQKAGELLASAREVSGRLLLSNPLEGVAPEHELALFDHLQPIFDGRFTSKLLLDYVSQC